jgi:RNA recognition motif-containing protein
MGTKEEDEDALLYGDVGDSDDEAKETMAKQTNVVAGVGGGNGGGEGGGEGDDKEKELEMKNNGDDDGIGAKEKTITGDGAQTNNNTSNAEKNDEDEEKSKSVYVANLTWWTTDVQVEQLASEFGVVKSVQFFTEKKNGKSKGCAVVEFTTAQSATSCAENLNKRAIDGKACVVTLAPAGSSGSNAMMGPRAPLGPPPDTAWKGPVPTKGGGVGGGIGMSTTQAQLNALQQQQKMKLLMMQQQMKAKLNAGAAKPTATTPPNAARKNAESTHSPANNNNNNNNNSNNNSPTTTTTTTTTRERPNSPLMANAAPHAARGRGGGRGGRGPRNRAESPPAGRGRKRARR